MTRLVIMHITDTHSGLRQGLTAPGTQIEYKDEDAEGKKTTRKDKIDLSDYSDWVWHEAYMPLVAKACEYAGNDPLLVVHTGDVIHGERHVGQEYCYTPFRDQQVSIAVQALDILRMLPTLCGFVFVHGTAAHDYGQQQGTHDVADAVAAWGYPVKCRSWISFDAGGADIDASHHGPSVGNGADLAVPARKHAIKLSREYSERGERPPSVMLSGHVHRRLTEYVEVPWGGNAHRVLCSVGAPLTGPNEYAERIVSQRGLPFVEAGGALISLEGGRVTDYLPVTSQRETRKRIMINWAFSNGKYSQGDGQLG